MPKRLAFDEQRLSIISDNPGVVGLKDTLQNSAKLLEMLEYLRLTEELTLDAEYGVFLTLETVVDALYYVSQQLDRYTPLSCPSDSQ